MNLLDVFKRKSEECPKYLKDSINNITQGLPPILSMVRLISSDGKLFYYVGKVEELNKIVIFNYNSSDYKLQSELYLPCDTPISLVSTNGYITTDDGRLVLVAEFKFIGHRLRISSN